MEEVIQNWLAAGTVGLTTIISILLCILKAVSLFKNNTKELEKTINDSLDLINEKTEARTELVMKKQNDIINSQQKQIEEQGKQIQELTKLVTKVVDKRVD